MKRFVILIALVLIVALGWSAGWFYISTLIKSEISSMADAEPSIECGETRISGFPFRFDIRCETALIVQADRTFSLPEIRVSALVYRPTHLQLFFASPLQVDDAFLGTSTQWQWQDARASVRLDGWSLARASMVADNVVAADTLLDETLLFETVRFEAHLIDAPQAAPIDGQQNVNLFVRLDQSHLPGLDVNSADALVEGRITNLPNDVRQWGTAQFFSRWRQANGGIEIADASLTSPSLSLKANGSGQITNEGFVDADATMVSTGLVERLRSTVDLPPMVLAMIAGTKINETDYQQTISISDGIVSISGVPMFQLAPLY